MIHMTSIPVAVAKARFSELLDRVTRGERFLVLRHGRPVAAVLPPSEVSTIRAAPAGLAALAGALADWDGLAAIVDEIYAARHREGDRPVPEFD